LYHEINSTTIDERIKNARLVRELVEEKTKLKKNYSSLLDDMKKFMFEAEKRVLENNLKKMNEEKEGIFDLTKAQHEVEVMKLNDEVAVLKEG
jgi:hypothetical protein